MKLIKISIILIIIISISFTSSAKTCNQLIEDTSLALEKNFQGFKNVKEIIIKKQITNVEVLQDIRKISEPKEINTIILARAHIYYENKEFLKAEDFLEKAIEDLKYNNQISKVERSEMIKDLTNILNRYGETKGRYWVETSGPEWGPINDFIDKSDYHITIGNEINFIKDKQPIGKVIVKRIIDNNIFELSGGFAYDSGKNIFPIIDDLEALANSINKDKGRNIAVFSRDLKNPTIEYLKIGNTQFKREGRYVECIINCK